MENNRIKGMLIYGELQLKRPGSKKWKWQLCPSVEARAERAEGIGTGRCSTSCYHNAFAINILDNGDTELHTCFGTYIFPYGEFEISDCWIEEEDLYGSLFQFKREELQKYQQNTEEFEQALDKADCSIEEVSDDWLRLKIKTKRMPDCIGLPLPMKHSEHSSGYDLCAAKETHLAPGDRVCVNCGFAFEPPDGYELQVRPRSGMSLKHGIVCIFGTIDNDYRGEVGVILHNISGSNYMIKMGDRIAQLVLSRIDKSEIIEVDELSKTDRGTKGFGSTGC